jgi:hypothetical protein
VDEAAVSDYGVQNKIPEMLRRGSRRFLDSGRALVFYARSSPKAAEGTCGFRHGEAGERYSGSII